jgi:hypothetical protein
MSEPDQGSCAGRLGAGGLESMSSDNLSET